MPRKGKDFARKSKIVNNDDSSVSVNNSDLIDKSIDNLITSNKDASNILLPSSTTRPTSLSADVDDCDIPGPSNAATFGNCLVNKNIKYPLKNIKLLEISLTGEQKPGKP